MTGQENFELFYHQLFCYRGVVSPSTTCSSSCYCMKPLSQALHYHLMPLRMMFGFTPPYPQVVPGLDTSGNKADWSRQPADHCCAVCTTAEASALLVPWLCVQQLEVGDIIEKIIDSRYIGIFKTYRQIIVIVSYPE